MDFGPFEVLFSRRPGYLSFFNMSSPDVQNALKRLSAILRSTDDADRYIALMLEDKNWRSHLVASVSMLLSREPAGCVPVLWRTFDDGSWVAPQLAVVLYFLDPAFGREAKQRIASRCPMSARPDLGAPFERAVRSKNIASLLRVVRLLPSEADWAASELQHADVLRFIEADRDASGDIADSWLEAVHIQFTMFGRDLRARST